MRLDEWQRWLDSQFLDDEPEPAAGETGSAAAPLEAEPAAAELTGVEETPLAVVEQSSPPSQPEPVAIQARPASSLVPAALQTAELTALAGEADVPEIENYLPFLRKKQEAASAEAAPVTEAQEPEPREPCAAEPPAQDVVVEPDAAAGPESGASLQPEPAVESAMPADRMAAPVSADPAHRRGSGPAGSGRPASSARRTRQVRTAESATAPAHDLAVADLWRLAPRSINTLLAMGPDDSVQNSYKRSFKETRIELISRLLDPSLSLEETARLLNVCPTTVRRYTQRGLLQHQRTKGDQRRFKLSDVLGFLEAQRRPDL